MGNARVVLVGESVGSQSNIQEIFKDGAAIALGWTSNLVQAQHLLRLSAGSANLLIFTLTQPSLNIEIIREIGLEFPGVALVLLAGGAVQLGLHERAAECGVKAVLPAEISGTALKTILALVLLGENLFSSTIPFKHPKREPSRDFPQEPSRVRSRSSSGTASNLWSKLGLDRSSKSQPAAAPTYMPENLFDLVTLVEAENEGRLPTPTIIQREQVQPSTKIRSLFGLGQSSRLN